MALTRRRFVEAASLTLLANAAHPLAFAQTGLSGNDATFSSQNVDLLARLSEESFKPLVGESFVVSQGAKRLVSLTLVSVVTATSPTPASGTRSALLSGNKTTSKSPAETLSGFSLHFKGSGKMLEQGTYTFKNGQLGKFPLFIVQGGPGMNPNTYTATFCQLVS